MSVIINTNSDALRIQGTLTSATDKLSQTMQRMSSGLKINEAKDDAAGTVISARMAVQLDGNKICQQNVQNANAMLSTAEGNLDVVLDNVSRIRDLTLQAKNGTYSAAEIKAMQDEVTQRIAEIDRVSDSAKYSQLKLFDDDTLGRTGATFQVGANATSNDIIAADGSLFKSIKFNDILVNDVKRETVDTKLADPTKVKGIVSDAHSLPDTVVDDNGEPKTVGDMYYNTNDASFYVAKAKTGEGATGNEWVAVKVDTTNTAETAIYKNGAAGAATDVGKICKLEVDGQVEYRICTAWDAEAAEGKKASYSKILEGFDPTAEAAKGTTAGAPVYSDTYKFDLTTMANSGTAKTFTQAINALDEAIDNLTNRKSLIGSLGNRLDSAFQTLTTQENNLTSAKSIITDADIASEAASYTQSQILQQVSTSLLAQANQSPSIALSLL